MKRKKKLKLGPKLGKEFQKIPNKHDHICSGFFLRWGWVFFISCLQNDFRKDPQVEPKFCRSLLTTKFVDVAPIGVVINIWNLS